jgi:parvulin-like peptidyl-prolyl isomerase
MRRLKLHIALISLLINPLSICAFAQTQPGSSKDEQQQLSKAREAFRELLEQYANTSALQQYSAEHQQQLSKAREAFQRLMEKYANAPALQQYSDQQQPQLSKAREAFKRLMEKYANTPVLQQHSDEQQQVPLKSLTNLKLNPIVSVQSWKGELR